MGIGALLWGYDAQIGGATVSVPSFRRDFGYTDAVHGYVLPAKWQSAFNAMSCVGGLIGGLAVGWIADRVGRKGAVTIACFISIGGVFIQFFTPPHANIGMIFGKLVNGAALGIYVATASSYCAEISPLALRGITTGSVNLWICLGQLMSNCVIEALGQRTDRNAYRIPFAIQWAFPVVLLAGLWWAPESPWHLVRKGKLDKALATLQRLGDPEHAELRLQQIADTIELEDRMAASTTYLDCFRASNFKRSTISMMTFICQQFVGVAFVLGYSSYFFQLAGFALDRAFQLGVGVTAIGIAGNLVALCTINIVGRRMGFVSGMAILTVINLIIGFCSLGHNQSARWAQAAFTLVYNFFYQVTIGPIGYVIFAEVGSAKLRSKTVGLGIVSNNITGLIFMIVIPYMVNPDEGNLQGKCGFVFGGLGAIGLIYSYFCIPETKGRTTDELDELFEHRIDMRHFSKTDLEEVRSRTQVQA